MDYDPRKYLVVMQTIPRTIAERVRERLSDHKAIIIQGARQVGKTTLIDQLIPDRARALWVNSDGPSDRLRWNDMDRRISWNTATSASRT